MTDPVTASQLAAASWEVLPTEQARVSMMDVLAGKGIATFDQGGGSFVAFSPRTDILATGGSDGGVLLLDEPYQKICP